VSGHCDRSRVAHNRALPDRSSDIKVPVGGTHIVGRKRSREPSDIGRSGSDHLRDNARRIDWTAGDPQCLLWACDLGDSTHSAIVVEDRDRIAARSQRQAPPLMFRRR
jgi:hypothetical protein